MTTSKCSRYTYVKKKHNNGDCEGCRLENAKYKRNKTAHNRTLAASQISETGTSCIAGTNPNITCGIPSSYEWFGCKGEACLKAEAKRRKDYKLVRQLKV